MADLDRPKLERPGGEGHDGKVERSHSDVHADSQDRATEAHSPGGSLPPVPAKSMDSVPLALTPTTSPTFSTAPEGYLGEEQTDDPRGTAAMALAVLSSGVGVQGAVPFGQEGQDRLTTSPRVGEQGENRVGESIRHSDDGTIARGTLAQSQDSHMQSPQKQQRRHSTGDLDYESSAEGQAHSPRTSSSTMPLNNTVVQLGPLSPPHHPLTATPPPPETSIKLGKLNEQVEEHASQTSGSRMQSLSHQLGARLSLASLRTDGYRDKHDPAEDGVALYQGRGPLLNQSPHTLPKHHEDPPVTLSVASPSYKRASYHYEEERAYVHSAQYIGETPGKSRVQYSPQGREQLAASLRESQSTSEGRPMSPLPAYSPTMESVLVKPKRKYTKKTPASQLFEAGSARISREDILAVPESELLQSDRGLVLKTQIPKKGRPISKHPSAASQSTPTLSSFGVLPAIHPYFSSSKATSVPFAVSSFAVNSSLSSGNVPVGRPPKLHQVYSSTQDDSHHRHLSQVEQQMQTPVRRKPGRPPLVSTVKRHSYSQSHSSLQSGPFSATPGPLYLTGQSQGSMEHSQRSLYDLTQHSTINRRTVADNDYEPSTSTGFIHYRDSSPPLSVMSSSTATSSQHGPTKRNSYPLSMENRQHIQGHEYQQQRLPYRLVESPTETKHHTARDQRSFSPQEYEEGMPSGLVRTFAEGHTPHQVSISGISGRKRSSSGATKRPSNRSSTSASDRQYDENDGGTLPINFAQPEQQAFRYDPGSEITRARKRISRPESRSADSGVYELQGESEYRPTWTDPFPERRGRPRSSSTISMQSRDHEQGLTFRERSPVHYPNNPHSRDSEMELQYPPTDVHMAQDRDIYHQRGSHRAHHYGHAHSRSLDLSFANRRPTTSQETQNHAASKEVIGRRGFPPGGSESLISPPSISPTFPPIVRTGIGQQRPTQDYFYERYQDSEPSLPPTSGIAKTTMADLLARQMSGNTKSSRDFTSPLSASMSRSMLAESNRGRGTGQVIKTTPKRSTKKGPGPHLKKHQILQQELHQMQREQEELEIQQALQLRQQQQEDEPIRTNPLMMHQQRSYAKIIAPHPPPQLHHHGEPPARHQSHPYHPQQPQPGRPPKQRVLMRSESASSVLYGPLSPQHQSQLQLRPRHSSYASSIGSGRGGGSGSGVSSTNTPSPSSTAASRRRQNQQQTILLRPVSLPMFVGPGGGVVDDSGSPVSMSSSSTSSTGRMAGQFFHPHGGPPPGQPLYRSLPALSPLSPYQLAPVSVQASTSASIEQRVGQGQELVGGQISGSKLSQPRHHRSAEYSSSEDRTSTVHPSPRSSPSVSLSSPQSAGGTAMSSGHSNPRSDIHNNSSASQYHHQYPPQSQPSYRSRVSSAGVGTLGSVGGSGGGHSMSRSTSLSLDAALASRRSGEMSASSSSSTLFHQDTDMSTSSSLTSLSSISSLATLSHRHSQSSFSTTSLSSSSFHHDQQQRPLSTSSSTLSTYHGKASSDSPRQQRSSQIIEDLDDDPRSMEPPSSIASHHYNHYHHRQHHPATPSHTDIVKAATAGRPPLPPVTYPPRSTTPTPASTPTPTLGPTLVRTEE